MFGLALCPCHLRKACEEWNVSFSLPFHAGELYVIWGIYALIRWETELWGEVEGVLKIVQTAACLEIVNALVGIVKSPWVTVFMQVFSRVWTLWAVMNISPSSQQSFFLLLACSSWALVEVPRYLFYAVNIMMEPPFPLFWLRYSLFAILYPTGITGELGCMYCALFDLWGGAKAISDVPQTKLILLVLIAVVILTYVPGKLYFQNASYLFSP